MVNIYKNIQHNNHNKQIPGSCSFLSFVAVSGGGVMDGDEGINDMVGAFQTRPRAGIDVEGYEYIEGLGRGYDDV